jgi:ribosomal protein S18 acetylase RimI-like enzyme
MAEGQVEVAGPAGREPLTATLSLGFAADPVARWFFPDPSTYQACFPRLVSAVAGRAFDHGSAHGLADGRAVALWLPPGIGPDDEAIVELMVGSVDAERFEELAAFGDQLQTFHPVDEHWYLTFVGVDPIAQGRGLGSVLLQHGLAICDRDGLPAYLEASTPRSRALYERLGFEEVGRIQAGTSPPVWAMRRDPRSPSDA